MKELTRSDRESTFSFSKSSRFPTKPLRRPFLEYTQPEKIAQQTSVREGGTGAWGPPPCPSDGFVKLGFVDSNDFKPKSSVADSRRTANQQSLSMIRREKQCRVKSLRPAPLNRTTLFTDCSGPGSGVGTGFANGGFNASRTCAGTSMFGSAGGSLGDLTVSKAYFHC